MNDKLKITTMKTFTINTATLFEKGHFAGNTISNDFARNGYISITFKTYNSKLTAISVNGFEITARSTYNKNAKTNAEKNANAIFLKRFYNDLEANNRQIIINQLFK